MTMTTYKIVETEEGTTYPKTLKDAYQSMLGNEHVCDIYLKCSNGGIQIPASKFALSAWSPVFRAMFYNKKYEESSASVIDVEYHSNVIRQLVEFCYTGKIEVIEQLENIKDGNILQNNVDIIHVQEMVALIDAANYYGIVVIVEEMEEFIQGVLLDKVPWAACCVFDSSFTNEYLFKMSLNFIRSHSVSCLNCDQSIKCLSAQSLGRIMNDSHLPVSQLFLFECLQKWVNTAVTSDDCCHLDDKLLEEGDDNMFNRLRDGKQLSRHIELSKIPPSKLVTVVEESGLFDMQDLFFAYKKQATSQLFKINGPVSFNVESLGSLTANFFFGILQITVKDAGIASVNGTYTIGTCGLENDNSPQYYKTAKWNGEERTYSIWLDDVNFFDGAWDGEWCIGILSKEDPRLCDKKLYYRGCYENMKIPTTGWRRYDDDPNRCFLTQCDREELEPAPTLTYDEDEI